MSTYSLWGFKQEARAAELFAAAIEEIDPDARREPSGRWYSTILKPSDCDTVLVLPNEGLGKSSCCILIGKELPGGVLWVTLFGPEHYNSQLALFGSPDFNQKFRDFILEYATGKEKP